MLQTKVYKKEPMTAKMLVEHIKAVGQAIIDDADKIAFDAHDLISIGISAEIEACAQFTKVNYQLERLADPRIGKDNDGRTEEA